MASINWPVCSIIPVRNSAELSDLNLSTTDSGTNNPGYLPGKYSLICSSVQQTDRGQQRDFYFGGLFKKFLNTGQIKDWMAHKKMGTGFLLFFCTLKSGEK